MLKKTHKSAEVGVNDFIIPIKSAFFAVFYVFRRKEKRDMSAN